MVVKANNWKELEKVEIKKVKAVKQHKKYWACGNWKDQECSYIDHEICLQDCVYRVTTLSYTIETI